MHKYYTLFSVMILFAAERDYTCALIKEANWSTNYPLDFPKVFRYDLLIQKLNSGREKKII